MSKSVETRQAEFVETTSPDSGLTTVGTVDSPRVRKCAQPSLVWNAMSNWAALGVSLVVGFLLTPFIIAHVGKGGYGIWTLVGSVIGYYGLLDLGISSAVGRYVAYHAGREDHRSLNETLSTAIVLFCGMGFLVLTFSLVLAGPLVRFFNVPVAEAAEVRYLIWLLGLGVALEFPGKIYRAAVRAHEHFVASNCVVIVVTLLRAGATVYVLVKGWGLVGIAAAYVATDLLGIACHIGLCRRLTPHVRIRLSHARKRIAGTLMAFGGTTMVIIIADVIRFNLDSIVLGKFLDMEAVAVYGIAAMLIRYLMRAITTGMGVIGPRFSRLVGEGDHQALRDLLLRSMWISAILSTVGCLALVVFGKALIVLWVGPQFSQAALVLVILATPFAFGLSQSPTIGALYALNKHRFFAVIAVAEAVLNLGLSLLLVQYYGIIGVALGTAIPMLLVKIIVQPIYLSSCLQIPIAVYYRRVLPSIIVLLAAAMSLLHE